MYIYLSCLTLRWISHAFSLFDKDSSNMDPYVAIPEDYAKEVRKRLRDRDEEESKAPNEQPRVQLTFASNADSSASIQPPKPEENLDAYNHQRLKQCLEFVISASYRRDMTPRTRIFLTSHQEAYEKALVNPLESPAAVSSVQALDKVYYTEAFYFSPREGKDYEQLEAFVKLR